MRFFKYFKSKKWNSPCWFAIIVYVLLLLVCCFVVAEYAWEIGFNYGIAVGGKIVLNFLLKLRMGG